MANIGIVSIAHYKEIVLFDLQPGGGFGLREARERVAGSVDSELPSLDEVVVEAAMIDDLWPDLFADDATQPIAHWWWHLGKIRDKTYPKELLPSHLRSVYSETENNAI